MHELNRPICLFDSGLGGITVLDEFVSALPNENFIYVADEKYCPYGMREDNYIIERIVKITAFLQNFNPKAIVIACNTASRFIDVARNACKCFVLDVISPTANYVAKISETKRVLLLATESTVLGGLYQKYLSQSGIVCDPLACSEFLPFIESAKVFGKQFKDVADKKFKSVDFESYDAVIYGCTHFGLIDSVIRDYLHGRLMTVSCGAPTLDLLKKYLICNNLLNSIFADKCANVQIYTTSKADILKKLLLFYGKNYKNINEISID